jgi:hypothetical protein
MSESVTLLVDSLYAEATKAVKSRAALSASTPELNLIWGDTAVSNICLVAAGTCEMGTQFL